MQINNPGLYVGNELQNPIIPRYENIFKFKQYTASVTVNGNDKLAKNMGGFVVPDGYIFLGILTISTGYGDQWNTTFSIYGNAVIAEIKNWYSSALTSEIKCMVVFVKIEYYTQNLID